MLIPLNSYAAPPVFEILIKDHLFYPDELVIPANTKVKLLVKNQDATPEEFESYELNREKVIPEIPRQLFLSGHYRPAFIHFLENFSLKQLKAKLLSKRVGNSHAVE